MPLNAMRVEPAWAGRFVVSNLGLVAQREGDVVETFEEAVAAEVVYRERGVEARAVRHDAAFEINRQSVVAELARAPREFGDLGVGERDGQDAVLRAVVHEDVCEGGRDDGAEAVVEERPGRVLARGAAAEVAPGDEDGRATVARLVQDERRVGRAVRIVAPVVEEELAEARALDALEELLRDDLVGVNV